MNYLLDTNIISDGEIKAGIEKLDNGKKKEKLLNWLENNLLTRFENRIVDIDTEVMLKWGFITVKLKKEGKHLPIIDSLIASTAQAKSFVLLTKNEKDFKNLDIKVINPFKVE